MDQEKIGKFISSCRKEAGLTQAALADRLGITDRAVSKWETGKGYPDITLLEPIAIAFRISVTELISGNPIHNANVSANMMRSKFYVCPICGNVIHSMGECVIGCHGIQLYPLSDEPSDEHHMIFIERSDD